LILVLVEQLGTASSAVGRQLLNIIDTAALAGVPAFEHYNIDTAA
jgi:hypothetical protein